MSGIEPLDFLQSVAGFAQANQPGFSLEKIRLATVDPAYVASTYPGTLPKVTFDGETALSGKRYAVMSPYWPQPSDRVVMIPLGATYLIIGPTDQDASAHLGGQLSIDQSGIGSALTTRTTIGSTEPRFVLQTNGQQNWGNGTNPVDTNLYRSGTNQLKTDDSLEIVGSLVVGGVVPGDSDVQKFTANGTWTKPAGAKRVWVRVVGGGGAGGGAAATVASQVSGGSGGQGGAYAESAVDASSVTSTVAVTVGAGGSGVSGAAGNSGSTSSFGAYVSAAGGAGGNANGAGGTLFTVIGGGGAQTITGDIIVPGGPGSPCSRLGTVSGQILPGNGGSSVLGNGGLCGNPGGGVGDAGTGYGSGGGGSANVPSQSARLGGAGSAGIVIVTTYF